MPFYRRWGNSTFVLLVRLLFGGRYTDLCYGYNAFWADVVPALRLNADGFEIETMMNIRALRAGLNVVEVASQKGRESTAKAACARSRTVGAFSARSSGSASPCEGKRDEAAARGPRRCL